MSDDLVKRWDEYAESSGVLSQLGMGKIIGQQMRDRIEALTAERDRLRDALIELIQQTHNCERELTEDLHHVDFCGESLPLTNAREALKGKTNE